MERLNLNQRELNIIAAARQAVADNDRRPVRIIPEGMTYDIGRVASFLEETMGIDIRQSLVRTEDGSNIFWPKLITNERPGGDWDEINVG